MSTYLELKEKAEQLMREAEIVRQEEISAVVADIKEKMKAYGLTLRDIGLAEGGRAKPARKVNPIKYRSPNGETWSGGPGRKPKWVVEAVEQGRNLEDFRV